MGARKSVFFLVIFAITACNNQQESRKFDTPEINIQVPTFTKSLIGKSCDYLDENKEYRGSVFYSERKVTSFQTNHIFTLVKNEKGEDLNNEFFKVGDNLVLNSHYIKELDGAMTANVNHTMKSSFNGSSGETTFSIDDKKVASLENCKDSEIKRLLTLDLAPHYKAISKELYPDNDKEQKFVEKLFDIVELHKRKDPLMGHHGPGIQAFNLSDIPFALVVNEKAGLVDIVLFNWNKDIFQGLEEDKRLSSMYKDKVYKLVGIPAEKLGSQGQNGDQIANFSYVLGANRMLSQLGLNPVDDIPAGFEPFVDWKPHPNYMKRSHPLRAALGISALPLYSPSMNKMYPEEIMSDPHLRDSALASLKSNGGFIRSVLGMMVHETYHVQEGEVFNDNTEGEEVSAQRAVVIENLKDEKAKKLFIAYKKIVFEIGKSMASGNDYQNELLEDLARTIEMIKTDYPEAWKFIWEYEYTEGFAEYTSAYSLIAAHVLSMQDEIGYQIEDQNNFAYRTGAIGGLYMSFILEKIPYKNGEHKKMSIWENIINKKGIIAYDMSYGDLVQKYNVQIDDNNKNEIELVKTYLIETLE